MGSNLSKFSTVPDVISRFAHSKKSFAKGARICIPVASILYSTTTSESDMFRALEQRLAQPWLEQLLCRGAPDGYPTSDLFAKWTAVLVTIVGNGFAMLELARKLCDTTEQLASYMMWVLEEKVKCPWSVLWTWLNHLLPGKSFPRGAILACEISIDVHGFAGCLAASMQKNVKNRSGFGMFCLWLFTMRHQCIEKVSLCKKYASFYACISYRAL